MDGPHWGPRRHFPQVSTFSHYAVMEITNKGLSNYVDASWLHSMYVRNDTNEPFLIVLDSIHFLFDFQGTMALGWVICIEQGNSPAVIVLCLPLSVFPFPFLFLFFFFFSYKTKSSFRFHHVVRSYLGSRNSIATLCDTASKSPWTSCIINGKKNKKIERTAVSSKEWQTMYAGKREVTSHSEPWAKG